MSNLLGDFRQFVREEKVKNLITGYTFFKHMSRYRRKTLLMV